MIAARRTYADAVVNLFRPNAVPFHFTDVQGHVETPIAGGVRLSATAYNGVDALTRQGDEDLAGAWGNRVIGATLSKTFARGVLGRVVGADSLALAQRVSTTRYDIHTDIPLWRSARRTASPMCGPAAR